MFFCVLSCKCDTGIEHHMFLCLQVVKAFMVISRRNSWADIVHHKLICMLTNMFYQVPDGPNKAVSATPVFLVEQVDLIGGIEFIFNEVFLDDFLKLISLSQIL